MTNCTAGENVNVSWSAGGRVSLGAGGGFIMFAYTYTEKSSSLQSACYAIGGILLIAGGIELLYSRNSSDDFFNLNKYHRNSGQAKLYLAVNADYAGIRLTKSF